MFARASQLNNSYMIPASQLTTRCLSRVDCQLASCRLLQISLTLSLAGIDLVNAIDNRLMFRNQMASNRVINAWQDLYSQLPLGKRRFNMCKKGKLPYLNCYPLALNVSLKIRFSISHSSLHHLYLLISHCWLWLIY